MLIHAATLMLIAVGSGGAAEEHDSVRLGVRQDCPPTVTLSVVSTEQPVSLRLDLENSCEWDLPVKLGIMLGNGRVILPEAIRLILVDPNGKKIELSFFDRRYPGVAGRMDDFVVPLRAGSTYSLILSLADFWSTEQPAPQDSIPAGRYRVHAEIDTPGERFSSGMIQLWQAELRSDAVAFEIH